MKNDYPKNIIRPTSHEKVVFKDGMIVTAEDLHSAMHYPLGVFQTLIRAFFGCGIVCGYKVDAVDGNTSCTEGDNKKNVWCLEIQPGVALDCHGFPLELCQPVKIDLTPDPCSCDAPPTCVCIAIRRYIEEDPQTKSDCKGNESEQASDCTRKREQVMIKVFEIDQNKKLELPENTCMRPLDTSCPQGEQGGYDRQTIPEALCNCLKACPDHSCCGEGWVLLACIKLGDCGIECIDNSRRKYVKPIDCLCPAEGKIPLNESVDFEEKVSTPREGGNHSKEYVESAVITPKSRSKNIKKPIKK